MINQDKPTPSVSNSAKVSIGETWDTWDTTWDNETRTWEELGKLIDNFARPTIQKGFLLKQDGFYLLLQTGGKIVINSSGGITNQTKP